MTDYTSNIYASVFVTLPFATLALVLRFIARRITTAPYGYDDGLAVIAYFGAVAHTIVALIWVTDYGLGRPVEDGPQNLTEPERLLKSRLLLWFESLTYSFAIAFCKFALLTFYWRIFKLSDIRVPIQVLLGLAIAWFVLRLFMVTLECIPIQALWDTSIEGAHCINETTFFFATVLTHVLIDVAILILPAVQIGKLHLRPGQKIAVIALFMFGIVVCIVATFDLILSSKFNAKSNEMTVEMGIIIAWAVAEVNLSVISTSLPMLRPIFRKIIRGPFLASHSGGQTAQSITRLSKGIKLTTIVKTKEHDADGSSSTDQLADREGGLSDLEVYVPGRTHAPPTIISDPWRKYDPSKDVDDYEQGIHVKNEIAVYFERV